jgi:hypothetical protein
MRLGRRLSAGIAEDPPAPTPAPGATVPAEATTPAPAQDVPVPERTPDPAVSGS